MKKSIKSKNIIVKTAADVFMPIGLILGIYVILHGHLSPGGGFQGGVIVASAVVLVYFAYGNEGLKKTFKLDVLKKGEAIGALMYSAFAFIGIVFDSNFCKNIFMDFKNPGKPGDLFSSGTIFFMNFSVGFKVLLGIGFLLLFMLGLLVDSGNKENE